MKQHTVLTRAFTGAAATLLAAAALVGPATPASAAVPFEVANLDGRGNNIAHPDWGRAGTPYSRVTASHYADGRSAMPGGPNARQISNRLFNDSHQNLFSERGVTGWGNVWGQFLDHTFGLRDDANGTAANIPFNPDDPLETFENDLGVVPFTRSGAAPGTGVTNPREQVNTVSSFIDGSAVYGDSAGRLDWLREGTVDGNPANNGARLLMPGDHLPRRDSRGAVGAAPPSDAGGRLAGTPGRATVAGDVRSSENISLTGTHTLFAREHNRIVSLLPASLSDEDRFQIARRVVAAEQQFITYTEFLPAVGVPLPPYPGYQPTVDPTLSNEFATVGYRAHSMIHGEVEVETDASRYSAADLAFFADQGIEVLPEGDDVALVIPLNVAFFNPDLVPRIGLGPLMHAIGAEPQYRNDEMIDNQLRSVLFQIPVGGNPECLDGAGLPECFDGVVDLGAIDIERGRDHGMPTYNQLRRAYGLAPHTSFAAITGETGDAFPADPALTSGDEINDPQSMDFTGLRDITGDVIEFGTDEAEGGAITGIRRTPIAARLRALYGSVDNVDAFVGMIAERHATGSDLGELQREIWLRQFAALRDGDRFFYQNDPALTDIRTRYGIDFRQTLAQIIVNNTDLEAADLAPNVFFDGGNVPPASCRVTYAVQTSWPGGFQVAMRVTNTGIVPVPSWLLRWTMPAGQAVTQLWNGVAVQEGRKVFVDNAAYNGSLAPGASIEGMGFNASGSPGGGPPTNFTLSTTACARG